LRTLIHHPICTVGSTSKEPHTSSHSKQFGTDRWGRPLHTPSTAPHARLPLPCTTAPASPLTPPPMDVSAVHAALAEYYSVVATAARHVKQSIDERFRALFSRRNLRGDASRRALHQGLASPHLTSPHLLAPPLLSIELGRTCASLLTPLIRFACSANVDLAFECAAPRAPASPTES
jgi:hypothetical protein